MAYPPAFYLHSWPLILITDSYYLSFKFLVYTEIKHFLIHSDSSKVRSIFVFVFCFLNRFNSYIYLCVSYLIFLFCFLFVLLIDFIFYRSFRFGAKLRGRYRFPIAPCPHKCIASPIITILYKNGTFVIIC